jgi:hypothetical protein
MVNNGFLYGYHLIGLLVGQPLSMVFVPNDDHRIDDRSSTQSKMDDREFWDKWLELPPSTSRIILRPATITIGAMLGLRVP